METIEKQKQWFVISNVGLVDINAFSLMGASTKIGNNNKIGMFGSGTKYAIAYLIRNNIPFKIYSGLKEIKFTTDIVNFRDCKFTKIIIDGKDTSLTAEMGKDWKKWFAIREFISNAIDEGGFSTYFENYLQPVPGVTTVFIDSYSIKDTINNLNTNFVYNLKPFVKLDNYKLFINKKSDISYAYRKDILCCTFKESSVFNYSSDFVINEYRESDSYDSRNKICYFWCNKANSNSIKYLLNSNNFRDSLEWNLNWYYTINNIIDWEEVIGNRFIVEADMAGFYIKENHQPDEYIQLPTYLCNNLLKASEKIKHISDTGNSSRFIPFKLNEKERLMLNKAEEFFTECDINLPNLNFVEAPNANLYGSFIEDNVYITKKAFSSTGQLVRTIYEEYIHSITKYFDKSLSLQNYLFDKIIELYSDKIAFVL